MQDVSEDVAAEVAKILALLADGPAFERPLAELRGLAQAADSRLKDVAAHRADITEARTLREDAAKLLAGHSAREAALTAREEKLS
jgi:hypothetical protein